jgi:hypothetical protein
MKTVCVKHIKQTATPSPREKMTVNKNMHKRMRQLGMIRRTYLADITQMERYFNCRVLEGLSDKDTPELRTASSEE